MEDCHLSPGIPEGNPGKDNASSNNQQSLEKYLISKIPIGNDGINMRVLDIGCGKNELLYLELKKKNPLICIDSLLLSDPKPLISDTPLSPVYNLIVSVSTLHQIPPKQEIFRRIAKWLVPGGILAVHHHSRNCLESVESTLLQSIRKLQLNRNYDGFEYPYFYPRETELIKTIKNAGFQSIFLFKPEILPPQCGAVCLEAILPFLEPLRPDEKSRLWAEVEKQIRLIHCDSACDYFVIAEKPPTR